MRTPPCGTDSQVPSTVQKKFSMIRHCNDVALVFAKFITVPIARVLMTRDPSKQANYRTRTPRLPGQEEDKIVSHLSEPHKNLQIVIKKT